MGERVFRGEIVPCATQWVPSALLCYINDNLMLVLYCFNHACAIRVYAKYIKAVNMGRADKRVW